MKKIMSERIFGLALIVLLSMNCYGDDKTQPMGDLSISIDQGTGANDTLESLANTYIQNLRDTFALMCHCFADQTSETCTDEDTPYLCFDSETECMETYGAPDANYQVSACEKAAFELDPTNSETFLACVNTSINKLKSCLQTASQTCGLDAFNDCMDMADGEEGKCTMPANVEAALDQCE